MHLPTVRPNASRIIITWPKEGDSAPPPPGTNNRKTILVRQNQTGEPIFGNHTQFAFNDSSSGPLTSTPTPSQAQSSQSSPSPPPFPIIELPPPLPASLSPPYADRPSSRPHAPSKGPIAKRTTSTTTTRRPHQVGSKLNTGKPAPPKLSESSAVDEVVQDWMTNYVHTTPRPYDEKRDCGMRPMREGRVVGGRDSQMGEFPWSVLIREATLLGFFIKTKCGGVLIDLKWVLTAAHCQPGMFGSLIVVVGEYDLSGKASNRQLAKPILRKVKRMIIHRDYNPSNFDNDIALLELESPFQVQPHVVPICLPDKEEDFSGQLALVAGWGKLSFGGPVPKVLQVAKLPVIGNKHCQDMYHNSGHIKIISDSFLCAGYENGGRDSCEGDSGGPLQVQRNDSRWVLAGTVSHGIKCAEPNLPGIYIRTAAYLPWIKAVTFHQDHNKRYGPTVLV